MAVDKEIQSHSKNDSSNNRRPGAGDSGGSNAKRQKKNEKYGFGGKKRHAKSGDAMSSGDMSAFSARKMKKGAPKGGGSKAPQRPGKGRRKAAAARK